MVFNTTRAKYVNQSPRGPHAQIDRSRAPNGPRTPKRVRFLRSIHLLSWADEPATFERADQNRNIEFAVASAASTSSIQLRKATCSISSQRAAEGALEMVPVFSGGRIG